MQKTRAPVKQASGVSNMEGGSTISTPSSQKDIEHKMKSMTNNLNQAKQAQPDLFAEPPRITKTGANYNKSANDGGGQSRMMIQDNYVDSKSQNATSKNMNQALKSQNNLDQYSLEP